MTANISARADAHEDHDREDLHTFHAYVGGDEDTCPCDGCVDDRAEGFDSDEERDEFENTAQEDHAYAVEAWVDRISDS